MNIGLAFGDNIKTEKLGRRRRYDFEFRENKYRIFLLPVILFFTVGLLVIRLVYLQIRQGTYYRFLSDSNRTKTTILHAPRGIIFDRNNVALVYNSPGFREFVNGKTELIDRQRANLLISQGKRDLEIDTLRKYPFKEVFSHALGYIGQISQDELEADTFGIYRPGDLVGRMGIEQTYESRLKGVDGKELLEVDANGKTVRTIGKTDPVPGEDIVLTLDLNLQKSAYVALEQVERGAVVVSTPTGEILSLVSKPSFNPNLFTLPSAEQKSDSGYTSVEQILADSNNQPLLNRAISGTYPPGSTFKLITAIAGLENKVIDDTYEVQDTGIVKVGAFSFANWYFTEYGKTEGSVNVVKAIKRSNDIFFYKVAELVGPDLLASTARKFGVGEKLGVDLEGEAKGVVPDSSWKKKVIGEQWYLGDTYHYGIGQGYLLTTPLQVNQWTAVIANGGILYKPHLLKNSKFDPPTGGRKLINEKNFSLIREGMIESCSPSGVAWPLFKLKIKNEKLKIDQKNFLEVSASESAGFQNSQEYREVVVACKTGTAQHGGEQTLPHAWITLFAPAYDPQIVVTVLAESSGEGSNIAAPVAKKILEEWFSR